MFRFNVQRPLGPDPLAGLLRRPSCRDALATAQQATKRLSQAPVFLAEGSNGAVWERTPVTGWASLGGAAIGGVGAAALN